MAVYSRLQELELGIVNKFVVLSDEGKRVLQQVSQGLTNESGQYEFSQEEMDLYKFCHTYDQSPVRKWYYGGFENFGEICVVRGGDGKYYSLRDEYFDLWESNINGDDFEESSY